ncbi:alpha-L-glutamate ligase [Gammaproteobacteria bacterium]|nr:alpha-L-glutamate ligase [Gammaproteobacteria bacterium]
MIYIIHENKEWLSPFEEALIELGAPYTFWYIPEMNFNLLDIPPEGVFYNRMSASSHSRNHRYEPELALGILEWLKRHNRKVVNGPRALDLEISKIRQYQELEKCNIKTPATFASVRKNTLLEGAMKISFPLISKHNRAGKGLGVYKFADKASLEKYINSDEFESSPDGINLLQQYIQSPDETIIRMEFVNAKFLYAVEVDTSEGFELCPSDSCQVESNCPTGDFQKFRILKDFQLSNLSSYEEFLAVNDIGIAGIEIIIDATGGVWTYDVNTNTNYNPLAEELADISAPKVVAEYLKNLDNQL